MNYPHVRKEVAIGLIFGLMATAILSREESNELSFDVLFPQNWYTRALNACIQVWSDLDGILAEPDLSLSNQLMFVDAAIGKMTYICSCLERLEHEEIGAEDYGYLHRMLYKIESRCEKLTGRRYDDRLSCLIDSVDKTKHAVISLFQTNNTRSRTKH